MQILKEKTLSPFEGGPTPQNLPQMVESLIKKYERKAKEYDAERNPESTGRSSELGAVVEDLKQALIFFAE